MLVASSCLFDYIRGDAVKLEHAPITVLSCRCTHNMGACISMA